MRERERESVCVCVGPPASSFFPTGLAGSLRIISASSDVQPSNGLDGGTFPNG